MKRKNNNSKLKCLSKKFLNDKYIEHGNIQFSVGGFYDDFKGQMFK